MQIERLYDRLSRGCGTINELNSLHILLENRMTPAEAARLTASISASRAASPPASQMASVRVVGDRFLDRVRRQGGARKLSNPEFRVDDLEWAKRLTHHLSLATTQTPAPFERRWLRGGAAFYQYASSRSSRLVVGFKGGARRLMMPTPQILQHLAQFGTDVLLLDGYQGSTYGDGARGSRGSTYGDGVRGFSNDFLGTVEWLRAFVGNHGAEHVVTFGTSGGGLPAVLSGLALQVHSVLAVGAVTQSSLEFARSGGTPTVEEIVGQYAIERPLPNLSLVYGLDSPMDANVARALVAALPEACVIPVEGAGHNCLYPLAERGELETVLATTLFQGHPSADLTA